MVCPLRLSSVAVESWERYSVGTPPSSHRMHDLGRSSNSGTKLPDRYMADIKARVCFDQVAVSMS